MFNKISNNILGLSLLATTLLFCNSAQAQLSFVQKDIKLDSNNYFQIKPNIKLSLHKNRTVISEGFSAKNLPIFCKIEHKIESISKVPLRVRIGDLQYVNALENKK